MAMDEVRFGVYIYTGLQALQRQVDTPGHNMFEHVNGLGRLFPCLATPLRSTLESIAGRGIFARIIPR